MNPFKTYKLDGLVGYSSYHVLFNDLTNKYDLTPPSSTSVSYMFNDFEADIKYLSSFN